MILFPRNVEKPDKKPQVPEAPADKLNSAEAKIQNTIKGVIELPKKDVAYSFETITEDMKKQRVSNLRKLAQKK